MSAWKKGGGRLAALTGAALVVPLAVGAAVVAAEPDEPGGTRAPVAVERRTSTAPDPAASTAPAEDQGTGRVDGGAAEADAAAPGRSGERPAPGRPDATAAEPGSLADVAGRKPPASRATPPQAGGLEQAAGRKPEKSSGAPGRSGEAPDRTKGLKQRADVAPDKVHDADTAPGGCLAEYGEDGQCLPAIPPSLAKHVQDMVKADQDVSSMPHHWDCSELRTYFADGIAVRKAGKDPQSLDVNKDGVACGPGD